MRAPSDPLAPELEQLAALMHAGRFAELEDRARQLLGSWPHSGSGWQLLGTALGKQGKDALQAWLMASQYLPHDAVVQLNLANALGRVGQLREAVAGYERTLILRPEFAEAHNNLGDVLLELGRTEEALLRFRRALAIKPEYADAHNNMGNALRKLARVDAAIDSFRRALAVNPDFTEARLNLANALRSTGRLDEAVTDYHRVLLMKPELSAAHAELGSALRLQRRTADAQASCDRALEIDQGSTAALAVLAELHADAGRFTEAENVFRRALSIDPQRPEAWAGIARVRRMTRADADWLASAQGLVEQGLPPQGELSLRFAIGKYFDDVGEFDQAFENYERANALARRCGPAHDRDMLKRTVDLIIRSHARRWMDRSRSAANPSARPVFIIGMLRSGTSLTEQILASHPGVFGAGELTFWGAESAAAIARAAAVNAPSIDISESALAGLGKAYLEMLGKLSPDASRVVNKFPTNFLFLGLIHAAFPCARIIHMRRNPVDTCLSIFFQHFEAANTHANDLGDLAHYYGEYRRLMRHWRTVLPDSLLEVPYEALVADPELWSRRMIEFLGLPWDSRCLEFHRTERTVVTASKWQVRQKIGASSVERWRHYEKFVADLLPLLEAGSG